MIRAALIALLLATPALAQQSVTTRDCSPVAVGTDNTQIIECGYPIEKHEAALERLEARLRSDLERAHTAEKQVLELQLNEVQRQRTDLQASYEKTVAELAALRSRISDIGEGVEDAKIDAARQALAEGDRSKADALFAEVEAMEQDSIDRAAEAAYQRGVIADQEIRWADAADHFSKAARLGPSVDRLHMAQLLAWRAGRYQAGYRFALERLDLTIAEFGENTTEHAAALHNLALMLDEVGQYEEAESLYRQGLEIARTTLGEAHPDYAAGLNNLGNLLVYMGRHSEAEPLLRQVVDILPQEHPTYSGSLNSLGGLLHNLGRFDEAEPLFRQAVEIDRGTLGEAHPHYAKSLNNLALFLQDTERLEEAETLFRKSLAISTATFGATHPDHATHLSNLANLLRSKGEFSEAERLYRQALEIDMATVGDEHPNYAIRLNNFARLMQDMGNPKEARSPFSQSLSIFVRTLGNDHAGTRQVAGNYANLLREHFPDDPALAELEATFGPEIGK